MLLGPSGSFPMLIESGVLLDWTRPVITRSMGAIFLELVDAEGSSVAGLRSFARGLRLGEAAVRSGAAVERSNGQVEGQVSRLMLIERTMYGRARFDLLRARVLLAG